MDNAFQVFEFHVFTSTGSLLLPRAFGKHPLQFASCISAFCSSTC
jgi:hypothetical protein